MSVPVRGGRKLSQALLTTISDIDPASCFIPLVDPNETALDRRNKRVMVSEFLSEGGVTSVSGTGTVNGITLSGTVTSSGSLVLGGSLAGVDLASQIAGVLPVENGGTNSATEQAARLNLLPAITGQAGKVLAVNGGETDYELVSGGGSGTVTSVSGTGTVNGITLTGTVTASGSLTLGGTLSGVSLTTQVTGILPTANGGTANAFFTVAGPAGSEKTYTFPNVNATMVDTTSAQTLTNKTISGADNTLTVDGTNVVGFRHVPQNSQSAAYTAVLADAGKHIFHPSADTTARIFTIPANSSVAYEVGTALTFVNQDSAGVITIAITTDTMRLAGAGTTGSRTLAANGIATALKVTTTSWIISGTGLT